MALSGGSAMVTVFASILTGSVPVPEWECSLTEQLGFLGSYQLTAGVPPTWPG